VRLLELSQGRAFCLFTSYSQMNDLFERGVRACRFHFCASTAPRSVLLERFKTPRRRCCLRQQFWQGVMCRRAAILRDRRPASICGAERPSWRRDCALYRKMGATVCGISVPQAVLALKQGFGP